MRSEFECIRMINGILPRSLQGVIGIGDDADYCKFKSGRHPILTTDTIVEGIDFLKDEIPAKLVGRKALAVSLSDIAAMGAEPTAFVINLGIPISTSDLWIREFYLGILSLAKQFQVRCLGGDLTRSLEIFASITVIGYAKKNRVITRSRARKGNWIGVTGKLGGSKLGHHCYFTPRIKEGVFLNSRYHPSAMIDISDGFVQDLRHILKGSNVGARIHLDRLPVSKNAFKIAKGNSRKAIESALTDGEDFELLFCVSSSQVRSLSRAWKKYFPRVTLSWVGEITGEKNQIEWFKKGQKVRRLNLMREGYSHFW